MEQLSLNLTPRIESPEITRDTANAALLLDEKITERIVSALRDTPEGRQLMRQIAQEVAEQVGANLLEQLSRRLSPSQYPTYTTQTWTSSGTPLPNPSRSWW